MKAEVYKIGIAELINIWTDLNNTKTKVDDLNVGKLQTVPIDLKNLNDVVDKTVAKNTEFKTLKTKLNSLEKKIPDASTLIQTSQ